MFLLTGMLIVVSFLVDHKASYLRNQWSWASELHKALTDEVERKYLLSDLRIYKDETNRTESWAVNLILLSMFCFFVSVGWILRVGHF